MNDFVYKKTFVTFFLKLMQYVFPIGNENI